MDDEKKRQFKERMEALHEKYCQQLPSKYQEIEDCWEHYQKDLSNPESIESFYRLIHTFKGTAATFGFLTQADICYEIQKLLLAVKDEYSILSNDEVNKIQEQIDELKLNINSPAKDSIN